MATQGNRLPTLHLQATSLFWRLRSSFNYLSSTSGLLTASLKRLKPCITCETNPTQLPGLNPSTKLTSLSTMAGDRPWQDQFPASSLSVRHPSVPCHSVQRGQSALAGPTVVEFGPTPRR